METFTYLLEEGKTFEAFFRRYEDLFTVDCEDWPNAKKFRLLLRKLRITEYSKFVDYILPKKTSELEFSEAVKLLSELFRPNSIIKNKIEYMHINVNLNSGLIYIYVKLAPFSLSTSLGRRGGRHSFPWIDSLYP